MFSTEALQWVISKGRKSHCVKKYSKILNHNSLHTIFHSFLFSNGDVQIHAQGNKLRVGAIMYIV